MHSIYKGATVVRLPHDADENSITELSNKQNPIVETKRSGDYVNFFMEISILIYIILVETN